MTEAYDAFAYAYDRALGEKFYGGAAKVLDHYVAPEKGSRHLDLACGTGLALEHFQKKGFRCAGVDASAPMLELARRRVGPDARLVLGDVRFVPLKGGFRWITCLYDSLNHILTIDDLEAVFHEVARLLAPRGQFLFDMNHPDAYPLIWGIQEPYVSSSDDHLLTLDTRYSKRQNLATADVKGWGRIGGRKVPIEERHYQRAYSIGSVRRLLRSAGLVVEEQQFFDPFAEDVFSGRDVKVIFLAHVP